MWHSSTGINLLQLLNIRRYGNVTISVRKVTYFFFASIIFSFLPPASEGWGKIIFSLCVSVHATRRAVCLFRLLHSRRRTFLFKSDNTSRISPTIWNTYIYVCNVDSTWWEGFIVPLPLDSYNFTIVIYGKWSGSRNTHPSRQVLSFITQEIYWMRLVHYVTETSLKSLSWEDDEATLLWMIWFLAMIPVNSKLA